MHLVQLLLPLYSNAGDPFGSDMFSAVRMELTQRFGGVTAFVRAPARGLWREEDGSVQRDDVVVYEVMAEELDEAWWAAYRERLRLQFEQDELVVRTFPVRLL